MTTNRALPDIGPLADVTVRPDGELWELIFVRALRHPPERVWTALTDPVEQRKWAPFVSDRDLGVLGDVTLTMIDGENREDLPGTVLRAEPAAPARAHLGHRPAALEAEIGRTRNPADTESQRDRAGLGAEGRRRVAPVPGRRREPARRPPDRPDH